MEFKLTKEDLDRLKAPFPVEKLGIKVQSTSKDKTKAMLVCYIQHTDVYDRLEEVDPAWEGLIVGEEWRGETCFVRYRITVKGVSRENIGEGQDPKGATSDGVKRTSMLFGVGRYLYDAATVWVPYNEQKDKYRKFTFDEYDRARNFGQAPVPVGSKATASLAPAPTSTAPATNSATISPAEANTLMGECRSRKVDMLAFNREIKRRGAMRPIDLPAEAYADVMTWIIRQSGAPNDPVEAETLEYEKVGISREAVHAYVGNLPEMAPAAVARNLAAMRTGHKIEALRKLFADAAARAKNKTASAA